MIPPEEVVLTQQSVKFFVFFLRQPNLQNYALN